MPTYDELKYLSLRRLEAANILNSNGIHDIAYHDSGYIVEFGLKAVICKKQGVSDYPDGERVFRTHHFDSLVTLAGLTDELTEKKARDRKFMRNWSITTRWSVEMRYRPIGDEESVATTFLEAVKSPEEGVLPWIQTHW